MNCPRLQYSDHPLASVFTSQCLSELVVLLSVEPGCSWTQAEITQDIQFVVLSMLGNKPDNDQPL